MSARRSTVGPFPLRTRATTPAVRRVVASSPNNAHPAQSTSTFQEGVRLRPEGQDGVVVGSLESRDALILEGVPNVVHVDRRNDRQARTTVSAHALSWSSVRASVP